jgi:hypothetical protein
MDKLYLIAFSGEFYRVDVQGQHYEKAASRNRDW